MATAVRRSRTTSTGPRTGPGDLSLGLDEALGGPPRPVGRGAHQVLQGPGLGTVRAQRPVLEVEQVRGADDLRDQVVSLLFAGHETTASATAWTVYWIDRTPGLAEQVLADEALLDATITESLRLSPPATLAGNRMTDNGMVLTPSIYLAHRRAATYEHPHTFDPARKPPPPGAFFPFGGGVRHCPGKDLALTEIRMIASTRPAPNTA